MKFPRTRELALVPPDAVACRQAAVIDVGIAESGGPGVAVDVLCSVLLDQMAVSLDTAAGGICKIHCELVLQIAPAHLIYMAGAAQLSDERNDGFVMDCSFALPQANGVYTMPAPIPFGVSESAASAAVEANDPAPEVLPSVAEAEVCCSVMSRTNEAVIGRPARGSVIAPLALALLALLALAQFAC